MTELLNLLRDGHARTTKLLAIELKTSEEDVKRQLEYLTNIGVIKKVDLSCAGCGENCTDGCGGNCGGSHGSGHSACSSCLPEGGFKNMGEMYEVV
ncbi:hypothetical protein [Butyrivibrio sp. VCB2006]|uniref:hypothetical protein n=1 Tax=Butyrivibrio sp. VCB2006 TaxID=1280679 RepID=UPI0003F7498F|nr:hypothetical protein [Butyrivibrio sp. VCB2006]